MKKISSKNIIVAGVDGDVIIYRSAYAAQYNLHTLKTTNGIFIKQSQRKRELKELQSLSPAETVITTASILRDEKAAINSLNRTMNGIFKNTKATEIIMYISGESNFREKVAYTAPYKGNRVLARPTYYEQVKEHVLRKYNCEISDNCEADDLLAMNLSKAYKVAEKQNNRDRCNFICCTIDKDLLTVPGWHYNFNQKKVKWVTNFEAAKFFYTQMIMGDTADNIKGIVGSGIGAATDTFQNITTVPDLEKATMYVYAENYGIDWFHPFIEHARLLHMQRYKDELWSPSINPREINV